MVKSSMRTEHIGSFEDAHRQAEKIVKFWRRHGYDTVKAWPEIEQQGTLRVVTVKTNLDKRGMPQ